MDFKKKIKTTKKLSSQEVNKILKLKKTFWKYSLKSHKNWFNQNMQQNDKNICLFTKNNLIGYVALRIRKIQFVNGKLILKKKYFLFDTLIIHKDFRKKKLSKLLMQEIFKLSKIHKIPLILICEKKTIAYYKKFNWLILNKKNVKILDHKNLKSIMIYKYGMTKKNRLLNCKLNIFFKS